jgi:hypothetical protein
MKLLHRTPYRSKQPFEIGSGSLCHVKLLEVILVEGKNNSKQRRMKN